MRNYMNPLMLALALSGAAGNAVHAETETSKSDLALTLNRDNVQQELDGLEEDAERIGRTKSNRTGELRSTKSKIKKLEAEQEFINELLNRFEAIERRLSAIEAKTGIKN